MITSRGFTSLALLLVVLGIAVVLGTGWYATRHVPTGLNQAPNNVVATTTVQVTALIGPSSIAASASGTWRAEVQNLNNEKLRYVVTWGDEVVPAQDRDITFPLNRAEKGYATEYATTTFTHTYTKPGTYSIHLDVVYLGSDGEYHGTSRGTQIVVH